MRREQIHRRAAIGAVTAMAVMPLSNARRMPAAESTARSTLGLVSYACSIRQRLMRTQDSSLNLFEPIRFLQHCHQLGAGGMQVKLGVLSPEQVVELRDFADRYGLCIDAVVALPSPGRDTQPFEEEIRTAAAVGVQAARTTIMPGRRYEQFKSLDEFRSAEDRGAKMLRQVVPILNKHRVALAVENHKDQRIDERVKLLKSLDCEYIGACLDTGNSVALLDDPYETVEALAPYAFTVHLKDQALTEYDEGFLLGDIPLGQGSFDLKRIVRIVREAKPDIRFALELITRDALKVPCMTDSYYTTLRNVSADDLARAMRMVRNHSASIQKVRTLSLEKQVELEDANIAASLKYARDELGLR